jgi:gliding motility-associated-like protein
MYIPFRATFSVLCLSVAVIHSHAQNISGIINSYAAVTLVSGNQITVTSIGSFAVGDHVLLIQMQGSDISTSNNSSFGDITSYNDAGNYDFGKIASIAGNSIALEDSVAKTYDPNGKVQLVRVPAYCDVTVSDTLTCKAWDGSSGGVLAFISNGTVTLNSDINVTGKGFRGGPACVGSWGCGSTSYFLNNVSSCQGGKKGEGISIPTLNDYTGGRGKIANGGGGGNPGNCGGGGGSNYGAGGVGGYEYNFCFNTIQGIGGQALDYSTGKLFMGGAGGTGFNDNGQPIYPGGHGGGIIIISANTLAGNGHNIVANGKSVTGLTNDESAGGGGGGGAVILDVQTYSGSVNASAAGGDGGSTYNNLFTSDCHGTGGGGGGGIIWISASSVPGTLTSTVTGGTAGLVLNPLSVCYNTTYGAAPGDDGEILFNYPPYNFIPPQQVSLLPDTTICPNASFLLNAGDGFVSYQWQDGSTDSTFTVSDTGTYHVQVIDSAGCFSYDTVLVDAYPPVSLPLFSDTSVCPQQSILLNAGTGNNTYLWQDGSVNSTLIATAPGLYWVQVTDSIGCIGYDSLVLTNYTYPLLFVGNDTSICPGTQVLFSAGLFENYLWQDGSVFPNFYASGPGMYSVAATDSNGCVQRDTAMVISFYEQPPDSLLADTVVCPNVPKTLTAPKGFVSYEWNDGSAGQALIIDQPGFYWVKVTNEFACYVTDTIQVKEECPTGIFIPNAFTPNHDGMNDVFTAIGYNVTEYHMSIFNRWGQIIFATRDISDGWNGTFEGKDCETGTYVYRISYVGELNGTASGGSYVGNVTLLR